MTNTNIFRPRMVPALVVGLVLFLFSAPVIGQEPEANEKNSNFVLKIGQRIVTEADLAIYGAMQGHGRQANRRLLAGKTRSRLLDIITERILFAEEARELGFDRDPALRLLIQDAVDKILANHYVHRHLFSNTTVGQAEIRDYYNAHKQAFKQPETAHAAHILLRVGPQASAGEIRAIETKAQSIRQRLAGGEPFDKLAAEFSEDTGTRNKGGDLGYFDRKGKVAAIADAAFSLKPGAISEPLRSSVGYHIVRLIDRRPAGIQSLKEAEGKIRPLLLREKKMAAVEADRRRLEKKFNLSMKNFQKDAPNAP